MSETNSTPPVTPATTNSSPSMTTTQTHNNNNGESSSSSKSKPKSSKPPKPTKEKAEASTGTGASAGGNKAKSAKELKKEKRAALVAAREGGGGEGGERASDVPTGTGNNSDKIDRNDKVVINGTPHPRNNHPHPNAQIQSQSQHVAAQESFYSHVTTHKTPNTLEASTSGKIHPIVVRLGVLMANGAMRGANSRTMGMMAAFQQVIRDYKTPENAVMWKDLMSHLSPMITYLEGCRPKGTGGGNAIRWLKSEINRIGDEGERTELEQKEYLIKAINSYLEVRIHLADQVIADTAREKIRPGSVVVTFARSSVVEQVLTEAWDDMRDSDPEATFSVIVVDSRPLNEGLGLLDSLTQHGIPCTYVLLTQASHLIARSTLVLLGGSALHSDGALYARSGTAVVAMMAKEHRIPVVACVETYKFGERVLLDGIASNELSGEDLFQLPEAGSGIKIKEDSRNGITALPLLCDLTPPSCITAVCTEIGFIPPSSVPTVLGKGHMQ